MNVVENTNNLYVTKQEFCKLCGISESTAYKLIKSKKVNFEKKRDGLLHYYAIPVEEAEQYIRERANRGVLCPPSKNGHRKASKNGMNRSLSFVFERRPHLFHGSLDNEPLPT